MKDGNKPIVVILKKEEKKKNKVEIIIDTIIIIVMFLGIFYGIYYIKNKLNFSTTYVPLGAPTK